MKLGATNAACDSRRWPRDDRALAAGNSKSIRFIWITAYRLLEFGDKSLSGRDSLEDIGYFWCTKHAHLARALPQLAAKPLPHCACLGFADDPLIFAQSAPLGLDNVIQRDTGPRSRAWNIQED